MKQCWCLDSGNGKPQTLSEIVNLIAADVPGDTAANILTALQTTVTRLTDGFLNQNKGFEKRRNHISTAAAVGSFAFKILWNSFLTFAGNIKKLYMDVNIR